MSAAGNHDLLQFVDLLRDTVKDGLRFGPVETDPGRAFLKFRRPAQRRQSDGKTVECRTDPGFTPGPSLARNQTLGFLLRFPIGGLIIGRVDAGLAPEDMGMAADHLVADRCCHIVEAEQTQFPGHLRMEDNLKEQVAQFVLQASPVLLLDRVGDFIGLLDRIGGDAVKGLHDIPRTTALAVAQPEHDVEQSVKRRIVVVGLFHGSAD